MDLERCKTCEHFEGVLERGRWQQALIQCNIFARRWPVPVGTGWCFLWRQRQEAEVVR